MRPGLSTGEGIRLGIEYGHVNILGNAIGFAFHAQLSYLPDFLILDPQVRDQLPGTRQGNPGLDKRLAGRLTVHVHVPGHRPRPSRSGRGALTPSA